MVLTGGTSMLPGLKARMVHSIRYDERERERDAVCVLVGSVYVNRVVY